MIVERAPVDCSLSQTSFESAMIRLTEMNARGDGPWREQGPGLVHLMVCVEEQFTAAKLVKHYEEMLRTRAFLRGNFVPPAIELTVVYSARRNWWAVLFDRYMFWSPGV